MCHTQKLPQDIRATQYRHSPVCVCVYMSVCLCGRLATLMNLPVSCAELCVVVVCLASRMSCRIVLAPLCCTHTHSLPAAARRLSSACFNCFNFLHKITCLCLHATIAEASCFILFYASPFSLSNRNFCSLTEYIVVVVAVLLLCSSIANWVNKFVTDTHN